MYLNPGPFDFTLGIAFKIFSLSSFKKFRDSKETGYAKSFFNNWIVIDALDH